MTVRPPGSAGPTTRTGTSTATSVRVRGHDLVNELIGHASYTQMLYLLLCRHMPDRVHSSSTPNPVFPTFCSLGLNKIKHLALGKGDFESASIDANT